MLLYQSRGGTRVIWWKPLWDYLVGAGATEKMPEAVPYTEREGLLESRAAEGEDWPGREPSADVGVCRREFIIQSCCSWTLCIQCQR